MRNIIDGWWHLIAAWLWYEDYETSRMASQRMSICNKCELKKKRIFGDICKSCGCVLAAKVRCIDCVCPEVKW